MSEVVSSNKVDLEFTATVKVVKDGETVKSIDPASWGDWCLKIDGKEINGSTCGDVKQLLASSPLSPSPAELEAVKEKAAGDDASPAIPPPPHSRDAGSAADGYFATPFVPAPPPAELEAVKEKVPGDDPAAQAQANSAATDSTARTENNSSQAQANPAADAAANTDKLNKINNMNGFKIGDTTFSKQDGKIISRSGDNGVAKDVSSEELEEILKRTNIDEIHQYGGGGSKNRKSKRRSYKKNNRRNTKRRQYR